MSYKISEERKLRRKLFFENKGLVAYYKLLIYKQDIECNIKITDLFKMK